MSDIRSACELFVATFSRSAQSLGTLKYSSVAISTNSQAVVTLSAEQNYFYEHVLMSDSPTVGGDMFLQIFAFDELQKRQYGWRWDGNTKKEVSNWNPRWTVFADRNGDALFSEPTSNGEALIYGAIQSNRFLIAQSLAAFLIALSACIEVEEVEFANDTRDDDMNHKQEFLVRIKKMLGTQAGVDLRGFFKFFFE